MLVGLVLTAFAVLVGPDGDATRSRSGRVVGAGAVLGAAVAVKVTAVVAAPFLILLAVGSTGRPGRRLTLRAALVTAGAVAGYGLCALPHGLGIGFLRALSGTGGLIEWTSVPTAVGMTVGYLGRWSGLTDGYDGTVAVARIVGLAVATAAVAGWWWSAWRVRTSDPDRAVRVCLRGAGLSFTVVAVLGPVFFPWYAITGLALLAVSVGEPWRGRAGAASAVLAVLILPNGMGLAPLTKGPGAVGVTVAVVVGAGWWASRHRWSRSGAPTPTGRPARGRSRTPDPRPGRGPHATP